ncbi:hypothetical protein E0H26_13870 [Micromonospora zingiberis]|uniref:Dibenzothiophene monooxygenase n=1 Tax=Micromonospora zingiberis TaxID=2053011 RepID=A0A4R0GHV7_9ACTN|nr:acyl-CoA dehydrogenase family protein [Micromonospora zingiberis]TCB96716.1 hypothetical protein E0H26_13870 [Micromonospora zingiberis]
MSTPWADIFAAELKLLRDTAADRDRRGGSDRESVRALKAAGVTRVRLAVDEGGHAASVSDLFDLVVDLAAADSSIAHALRAHFVFGEGALHSRGRGGDRWLAEIAAGRTFGSAVSEQSDLRPMDLQVTIERDGDGYRLSGNKHYTTGSVYADWIQVLARDESGGIVRTRIPTDRDGVDIRDDFDGIGQRGSASGSIRFTNVRLAADEVSADDGTGPRSARYRKTFSQLYLAALLAGIAEAARDEAARYVLTRARVAAHGHTDRPRDDLFVQRGIGQIAADAAAARSLVRTAAQRLDTASELITRTGDAPSVDELAALSVEVTQVHTVVSRLAIAAAERVFTVGSGSAVSAALNLDRHWRNARTVSAHSPMDYKDQVVGAYVLNGAHPPDNGYF